MSKIIEEEQVMSQGKPNGAGAQGISADAHSSFIDCAGQRLTLQNCERREWQ